MDENELKSITFKVSSEEAENIDNAARQAGLSRSEYLRQRLLVPQEGLQPAEKMGGDQRHYPPAVPNPLRHRPAP
jgi:Ribbon-helix-helix protein, copG family